MQIRTTIRKNVAGLLLFTGLMAGAVSCKKDKNENPGNNPPPPPPAERLKEFKTGEEFIRFEYTTTGAVNKVVLNNDATTGGATLTYNVTYAGNKIAALETPGEKIVAVYENNTLARADIFQDNERVGYTTYQYENNLLKKATISFGDGDEFIPVLEFRFAYNAAGNVTENVSFVADGEGQLARAGHVSYQYDQKANPLYAQRELMSLFWLAPSKNNITVENHFDADQQPEDKFVFDYTYNTNGLPKSAVVTQGLPGQQPTITNVQYIY